MEGGCWGSCLQEEGDTGSWNSESLAQGMLEALTWLCMGRAVLLGAGGESGSHGLLEKSLGKGDLNPPSFHVAFPFFRVNFHLQSPPFGFSFDFCMCV